MYIAIFEIDSDDSCKNVKDVIVIEDIVAIRKAF